jgi:hypothetical protein
MNKVTIRNDFSRKSITVNASKPITAKKVASWRKKLHAAGCTSGDDLGGRGPQDDPKEYAALLARAQRVLATKIDETQTH